MVIIASIIPFPCISMETLGVTFHDKTMDRNAPMKLLLLRPIRSDAS